MSSPQPEPLPRPRVSERIFESLARAILRGELKPGAVLATQRELAKRFAVSPLLVRQAVHRLEELGLVRVRQGSSTIVLDPNESADIRLLQLQIELAGPGRDMVAIVLEIQTLAIVPMLVLAERRIGDEELAGLAQLTEGLRTDASSREIRRFVMDYWRRIARATRNPWFQHQVRWWWMLAEELSNRGRKVPLPGTPDLVARTYTELTRALSQRQGSVQVYLAAISPLLAWLDDQRAQPSFESKNA